MELHGNDKYLNNKAMVKLKLKKKSMVKMKCKIRTGTGFYIPRKKIYKKWKLIPENLDVLITHSPSLGFFFFF
jgi:spore coat polysaccharide biosynthesis predicted glycosyltransferase SpsG